jgi:hypothetical protein
MARKSTRTYVRNKRTVLKSVGVSTGTHTAGGLPKTPRRPQPSMPRYKCLEFPLWDKSK